ncbi:alpha-(1,3)-fucosyltransferase C-like isoform X2 [Colias croceus]|uniref:alpha-(1,3)-fucosyltransferase C-like isoform X2 n=1 Tax=Colias crocea TaxID=72248 RepID=UPI001E27E13F|nr:alpha-(1,3)-fucosyltransferase C-like isoform X2 [Colias croceus]XP_045504835.1 alpha-(1,3)-fucosyltransferase C-like isoform X2 [Colias croceus]XP_045504838.1 alpha-(1,3)-fucosyltransferase C-like isoform X2 [Colias croceus]XP_045504839.1 alpha-(1,3)-fucosyltransferase C-like isoform X2 [Colias croceus]XP_045504840.1 alpha-(1,3)-fucosyltransferase C-like isoform X2 [Colias croceus]
MSHEIVRRRKNVTMWKLKCVCLFLCAIALLQIYAEVYRKTERLPVETKFILWWTPEDIAPFYFFDHGQRGFIKKNCSLINCFVTSDRNLFNGDLTKFHAIAFNGRSIVNMPSSHLPKQRTQEQKYIFFNMESADNYPICGQHFEDFFNWTSTYKLDSDLPYPYIQIKNLDGQIVGPEKNMTWEETPGGISEDLFYRIQNKTKAVAWFVSNCKSRNNRLELAKELQKALSVHGYTVDIYGECGPLKCPRSTVHDCNSFLERDYFFYLSFENSFSEDYVTEKLLTALQHDVVPIVFGGADYSRFLPPGSYLDARKSTPQELASTIANLIKYPKTYSHYFRWKNNYMYRNPATTDNVCALCAAMNNVEMMKSQTTYPNFRHWWNPNYKERCS